MEDKPEIAFFDLETTIPTRTGQGYAILEFGSILVCPKKLVELRNYSTLVRPANLSHISSLSVRCNGITKQDVLNAPSFADVADLIYDLLNGRVWAGHNIAKFDCVRLREAFAEINRPAPEPKGMIDSLTILREKFGRRAGNMKMATLATYFNLGQQSHRSLDDVRMNLEVLKYCATVLFLESCLPDIIMDSSWVTPSSSTRHRNNGKNLVEQSASTASSGLMAENHPESPGSNHKMEENHPISSLVSRNDDGVNLTPLEPSPAWVDSFNMACLRDQIENEPLPEDSMEEEETTSTPQESSTAASLEVPSGFNEFLEPDDISIPSLSVTLAPFYHGIRKVQILHKSSPLQLCCRNLKIRFGVSTKFVDHAGRPRLSFVVDALPNLCKILDASDGLARNLAIDSGSSSEWRPVVTRKPGFFNTPTIRLHLPTVADGDIIQWATEMYQKDTAATQKLVFSRFDVRELDSLLVAGNLIDVYFSLEAYDYHSNAGIRLVAKTLVLHS